MISLVSFSSAHGGEGVKVFADIDGVKCSYLISADDFISLGLVKGEIDVSLLDEIEKSDGCYAAYRAAVRILSSGECSAKMLYQKLRKRDFSHGSAEFASKKLLDGGYIDEERQIESYLLQLVTKKFYGRRKIIPYLLARGYSAGKINAVLDEKYTDRDFSAAKKAFLEKKFGKSRPSTREEAAEMKKELYKRGY